MHLVIPIFNTDIDRELTPPDLCVFTPDMEKYAQDFKDVLNQYKQNSSDLLSKNQDMQAIEFYMQGTVKLFIAPGTIQELKYKQKYPINPLPILSETFDFPIVEINYKDEISVLYFTVNKIAGLYFHIDIFSDYAIENRFYSSYMSEIQWSSIFN